MYKIVIYYQVSPDVEKYSIEINSKQAVIDIINLYKKAGFLFKVFSMYCVKLKQVNLVNGYLI